MPLSHFSKVFAVEDAAIAVMLTDVAGGSTTYGSLIDVPGIKSVEVSGTIESKTLRGDNTKLDSDAVLTDVTATVTHAKDSLDVLAAFFGSTATDTGTTPNEVARFRLTRTSRPAPFLLVAKTPTSGGDVIGGDVHLVLYKCILSSFPDLGMAEEDYRTRSFQVSASPRLSDGFWLDDEYRETATALAVPA